MDSSVHLIYHDPSDLGSLILIRIILKEFTHYDWPWQAFCFYCIGETLINKPKPPYLRVWMNAPPPPLSEGLDVALN